MMAKDKPTINMLKTKRVLLIKRIRLRRDTIRKNIVCQKIQKKLEEYKLKSSNTIATWSRG